MPYRKARGSDRLLGAQAVLPGFAYGEPVQGEIRVFEGIAGADRATPGAAAGHFFDRRLPQSQFDTLEDPANAIVVDIAPPPEKIAETIRSRLAL